ncbi:MULTISPECIES: 30S ribosomal protein S8 [Methylocaldum]|jgi:small subunit ribosomal protein S8|uniref:30S ribosomal protein S8 n=1 Tax=unclassified Methylocaldum TaxID=2622260 RepID=UPI00098B250D|nr:MULTISPECIES: 30S ribosomal protein S8 [unclassified Methylocaldum]MVF22730.1 30S ribosomal protein S8 [Methylocaldum sp. BRCS4]
MSMTDPLADMIIRIRNGQAAGKNEVVMPSSNVKIAVCRVLKDEGYITDYQVSQDAGKASLCVQLKYYKGQPVIEQFERVSKPGRRIYRSKDKLPLILGGLGTAIVSTSKGVMTDKDAREGGHGGEVLCLVS